MALMKWEPFEGLTTLRREMDRLWEHFFDGSHLPVSGDGGLEPAVEIADTTDTVIVKAQLPGFTKDQVQVQITDDRLTIKGEMREEEKKEDKNYYRREFRYGAFTRNITLPTAVQADKAEAQLKDGILQITIPKSAQAKAQEIPISA